MIEFGRFASVDRRQRGKGKPETFTFLGFTHHCGVTRKGSYVVWRYTARRRLEAKLQQIKQTLRERMHEPVPLVGAWLGRVVRGFYQYHAVPGNWTNLERFRQRIGWYWQRTLARRSQTGRIAADRLGQLCNQYLPRPRLMHPYPEVRFDATHPR